MEEPEFCYRCRRRGPLCFCADVRPVRSEARFAVILHPKEARRTIGTARMVSLCLEDSLLIEGTGAAMDQNPRLRALLEDPTYEVRLLFPGPQAVAVEEFRPGAGKRAVFLIVDGTWSQAKKMIRTSRVLSALPTVSFAGGRSSAYQFRRQPAAHCLSTVETVHEVISRREPGRRDHQILLDLFGRMVASLLEFTEGRQVALRGVRVSKV